MATAYYEFGFNELNISAEDLINKGRADDEIIVETCHKVVDLCSSRLSGRNEMAKAETTLADISITDGVLQFNNVYFEIGRRLARKYKNATQAIAILCTAGNQYEHYGQEAIASGDYLGAYYFDLLGSMVVEKATEKVQQQMLENHQLTDLHFTNRYGPGYCDWHVSEQKKLLSLINNDFVNVSLSDSCLMYPIKSLSGICGIGQDVKYIEHHCCLCKSMSCIYRQA